MRYVEWQTEIADRHSDHKYTSEVSNIERQGLIVITSDMHWTGLYGKSGQPILLKVLGYGTDKERQEVYGPDILPSETSRRIKWLRVKGQTEDLSNAELNELIRLGG